MLNDGVSERTVNGGVEEIPLFFGEGIFGVVHRPMSSGLPGWVLCSPLGSERNNSQRLFFEWARYLAEAGYWVLRFDYRGTGDSAGRFQDTTVQSYIDDIFNATSEIERLSGLPCRGVLGLRLGADLAAGFVEKSKRPISLVMWEPISNGSAYCNSLLRTAMANELMNSGVPKKTRADFRRELAEGGSVFVDGFPMTSQMFESLEEIDLPTLGRPTSEPILVLEINSRHNRPTKPAVSDLTGIYSADGEVCIDSVVEPRVWIKTKSYRWRLGDLFAKTLRWIEETRSPTSLVANPCADARQIFTRGHRTEYPVGFSVEGKQVWGILHRPSKPRENAPSIVLVSAGEACRAAFFYPRLARELAGRGWRVLRFDPRGIGDSRGDFDCDWLADVFHEIEHGALVPDTVAALDFMETETGTRESVLVGLCGGALTSAFTAQIDDRVIGMALLDFSLKLTPSTTPDQKQSQPKSQLPWHQEFSQRESTLFLLSLRRSFHKIRNRGRRFGRAIAKAKSSHSSCVPGDDDWFRQQLGEDANLMILAALRKAVDRKVPTCCVFADTEDARLLETVLPGVRAGKTDGALLVGPRVIQGADHNFIMPGCAEKVTDQVVDWLNDPSVPWADEIRRD